MSDQKKRKKVRNIPFSKNLSYCYNNNTLLVLEHNSMNNTLAISQQPTTSMAKGGGVCVVGQESVAK